MLKVGITGKSGFIGYHLYNNLLLNKENYIIIDFDRDYFMSQDLMDSFSSKCDIIVHLASINRDKDPDLLYKTNLELAQSLVDSLFRTKYKGLFIFASSIQESLDNPFGNSKKESRLLFQNWSDKCGGKFKALIIPNIFGPFCKPNYNSVISTFSHKLINNEELVILNDNKLNLLYIDDLIHLILKTFNDVESENIIQISHKYEYKVSEILDVLNYFKNTYLIKGEIPSLNSDYNIQLFNTFRSYINNETFFPVKHKNNIDNRGNFVEIVRFNSSGQVSYSSSKPGIIRGNHFHTRKIERFSVIKGNAILQLRKVGNSEIHKYFLNGENPSFVDIPIWHIHNIVNIGDEDLYTVFWINEVFNPEDSDTYYENI